MKNFMLALILVITTGQDIAFGRAGQQNLPRLVEVRLSEVVGLSLEKLPLTYSLAILPSSVLQQSERDALRQSIRNAREVFACAGLALCSAGGLAAMTYGAVGITAILFNLDVVESMDVVLAAGLLGGGILTLGFVNEQLHEKMERFRNIKPALASIEEGIASDNNIAIYKSGNVHRVGMLSSAADGFTIVDAQGNKESIAAEQLIQLVSIGDALPRDNDRPINVVLDKIRRIYSYIQVIEGDADGVGAISSSPAISTYSANDYRGATLAFTYGGENHLGIVANVGSTADDQGKLVVVTSAGKEFHIASSRIGKPVVIDPRTDKKSRYKLRGALFLP